MKCTISQEKFFEILEWILFIGFAIVAGWFAEEAFVHWVSKKTSFSQHEETVADYPVITLVLFPHQTSEAEITNITIMYR